MIFKKTNILLSILFFALFATITAHGGNQENPLVKAIQLYDDGEFAEAEQILKKLLDEKPDHLMVNYYYGACRTENGYYGTNEIIYLLNGSTGEAPLKTEYYLGVQYHAKNRWDEALKHYTRFKGDVNDEMQNEVQLNAKIQQCYDKINPFVSEEIDEVPADVMPVAVPRENELEEYNPVIVADSVAGADSAKAELLDSTQTHTEELTEVAVHVEPEFEPINFVINGEITYLDTTNFQTKKGLKAYTEGNKMQAELDNQTTELDELRKQYGESKSYPEKQAIGEKILSSETNNYKLQSQVKDLFLQAKQYEIDYWDNAPIEEKEAFLSEIDEQLKSMEQVEVVQELETDSTRLIDPTIFLTAPLQPPATESEVDDELTYKIQLGAYSRGIPSYRKKQLDKLQYIRKIENYTDEKGVVVYTTGNLTNYDDALKMQNQVRQEGVKDAFVVPYYNGKRITLKEAKEIEAGK